MTVQLYNKEDFEKFFSDGGLSTILFYLDSDENCEAVKEKFYEIALKQSKVKIGQINVELAKEEGKFPERGDRKGPVYTVGFYIEGKVTIKLPIKINRYPDKGSSHYVCNKL